MTITEKQVINIVQQVYDMRAAQTQYFKHRNDMNLRNSIAKEKTVDNTIEWFLSEGLLKRKTPPAPPQKLFV